MPPSTFIDIKNAGGYDYEVRNFGDDEMVYVSISKGKQRGAYNVEADETTERMTATFPGYGQLDMAFKPKGEPKKTDLPKGCTGKRGEVQRGVWKGIFEFDTTYNNLEVTKAAGRIVKLGRIDDCEGEPSRPPVSLNVSCPGSGESAFFSAQQQTKKSTAGYFATQSFPAPSPDQVGRYFETFVRGPKNTFDYDLEAGTATVSPPRPFTGTASLATGGTFSGDLFVKFIDGSTRSLGSGCTGQVGRFIGR